MSLKKLPKINAKMAHGVKWDAPSDALEKWNSSLVSAESADATITMYDQIGSDGWTDGVTAKRISAALRSIGSRDVTVSINSPGGDFFEGIAIYNLLREHPHKITVKVVGLAASAASIVAMAGDEIQISKAASMMIHKAWAMVIGNDDDMNAAAEVLKEFNESMVDIYAQATGNSADAIFDMLVGPRREGTWMRGQAAIDSGFATGLLSSDDITEDKENSGSAHAAIRKVEMVLAQQGLPRSERRSLLYQIKGTRDATPQPDDELLLAGLAELTENIRIFGTSSRKYF